MASATAMAVMNATYLRQRGNSARGFAEGKELADILVIFLNELAVRVFLDHVQ